MSSTNSFVSLMYHNVIKPGEHFPALNRSILRYFTSEIEFQRQMKMIHENARCITLDELLTWDTKQHGQMIGNKKNIHLTFDDGWLGTWETAAPILEKYQLEATVFITTNLINKPGFISDHHLKNLPDCIKIGSHAHTHTMLDELSYEGVKEELLTSRKILEDLTGREINTFAFPGGSFIRDHLKIAQDVGFKLLFNSMIGVNHQFDPLFIKRIAIYDWTGESTFNRYLRHQVMPEFVRQQALSIPKKLLSKKHYLKIREYLLGEIHD